MFKQIKEFFTGKPAEVVAEVPYKVEVANAPFSTIVDTADIAIAQLATPVAEQAVEAVVKPVAPAKKPAPKKQQPVKKTAAPKTAQPKSAPKPKAPPKPKAKPSA
jgi:hypothetical protein